MNDPATMHTGPLGSTIHVLHADAGTVAELAAVDWNRCFPMVCLDPIRGLITLMAPSRLRIDSLLPMKSSTKRRGFVRRPAIDSVMSDPWERGRPARKRGPEVRRRRPATWQSGWGTRVPGRRKPRHGKGRNTLEKPTPPACCGRDARVPRFATGAWLRLCRIGCFTIRKAEACALRPAEDAATGSSDTLCIRMPSKRAPGRCRSSIRGRIRAHRALLP